MAVDLYMPRYADAVPVTNGVAWYGPLISLAGVSGIFIQIVCQNGAAGTAYLNPTNADLTLSPQCFFQANGQPIFGYQSNQAVSANGNAAMKMVITDGGGSANKFYMAFSPTANGLLYMAVNLTRIAN